MEDRHTHSNDFLLTKENVLSGMIVKDASYPKLFCQFGIHREAIANRSGLPDTRKSKQATEIQFPATVRILKDGDGQGMRFRILRRKLWSRPEGGPFREVGRSRLFVLSKQL